MLRLGAIFVVICMVLIASSLGAVLYLGFGLGGAESAITALVTLVALALYNAVTTRLRDRSDIGEQIADLSRGSADVARQTAELGRRLNALEAAGRGSSDSADKVREATAPIAAELAELSTLVRQLAETVSGHELKLVAAQAAQMSASAPSYAAPPSAAPASTPLTETKVLGFSREGLAHAIGEAIEANRVDLYLQPIVTLPQRKVRYYEALSWLRTEDGVTLKPSDFADLAEAHGFAARIDNMLIFRSVQVLRRLLLKNRDIGLFCGLSPSTLVDPDVFPQLAQFLDANRALAPSLVLQFSHRALREMGLIEQESLAALRAFGFRFCVDQVADLRMEPRELADHGIRFVKAPAALLLGDAKAPSGDIHAADLSDLLNRFGIGLIAERIEAESQVVDLLDFELRFGQGLLFSPPRPVRAEALQGADAPAASDQPRDRPQAAAGAAF